MKESLTYLVDQIPFLVIVDGCQTIASVRIGKFCYGSRAMILMMILLILKLERMVKDKIILLWVSDH